MGESNTRRRRVVLRAQRGQRPRLRRSAKKETPTPIRENVGYRSTRQSYTRKGSTVNKNTASVLKSEVRAFVGLDVHKDTVAIAIADAEGSRAIGVIKNELEQLRKALRKLGPPASLRVCYEAGACGYVIQRYLQRLKIDCVVVAPSLIPKKPGDRIKTDKRDATALASLLRGGQLTAVWIPDARHEALRDVIRAREDAVEDRQRARHRLVKMLLRLGISPPAGVRAWTIKYRRWLDTLQWKERSQELVFTEYRQSLLEIESRIVRLERQIDSAAKASPHAGLIEALQALRGVKLLTAATIVAEVGDVTRFRSPRELMAYAGVVPREHSSGGRTCRGGITKTGNAHLRRVIIESAWHYRHQPVVSAALRARQNGLEPEVCRIAWGAQQRLCKRYRHLSARGKTKQKTIIAVGRELLGFVWAIGQYMNAKHQDQAA